MGPFFKALGSFWYSPVPRGQGQSWTKRWAKTLRGTWTLTNGRRWVSDGFLGCFRWVILGASAAGNVGPGTTCGCTRPIKPGIPSRNLTRRRKSIGAGWQWDTSAAHGPVCVSPTLCQTWSWWKIGPQRPHPNFDVTFDVTFGAWKPLILVNYGI